MSWHVNEEAPLPDEVQDEDVLVDGARGVQGLIQDFCDAASHGFGGDLHKQIMALV